MKVMSVLLTVLALAITLLLISAPAALAGSQGGCPSVRAIGNFQQSSEVTFLYQDDGTGTGTDVYFFTGNANPTAGLIQYCVYPDQGILPNDGNADYTGWNFVVPRHNRGWFGFKRPHGNPTNIPFDGTTYQVGHASWGVDGSGNSLAPAVQTVLLHINDTDECTALYGTPTDTCFVFPASGGQQ